MESPVTHTEYIPKPFFCSSVKAEGGLSRSVEFNRVTHHRTLAAYLARKNASMLVSSKLAVPLPFLRISLMLLLIWMQSRTIRHKKPTRKKTQSQECLNHAKRSAHCHHKPRKRRAFHGESPAQSTKRLGAARHFSEMGVYIARCGPCGCRHRGRDVYKCFLKTSLRLKDISKTSMPSSVPCTANPTS